MPSVQKALFLEKQFGEFVVGETEIYKPGPGEILVKIQASALNPVDWKIKQLNYGPLVQTYPAVLGTDISGDVEELGEGVAEFKKGDRVFFHGIFGNPGSGFQQYAVAPAAIVAKIPPNLTYDEASALPVALTAAYIGLYNKAPFGLGLEPPVSESTQGIYTGNTIVVIGGATSVGQLVIQFAKLSGFSNVITTASLRHTDLLESLGATNVLDRNLATSTLVAEINKISGGNPIKYVFDTVASATTQQDTLDILASGGQAMSTLGVAVEVPADKTFGFVYGLVRVPQNFDLCATLYHDKIYGFLERGVIKPNEIEVIPNGLAGIPAGLARLGADQISGLKLVAHPQET